MSLETARSKLRRALPSAPPSDITQRAHDFDDAHLRRLAKLSPGDRPLPNDLSAYMDDLLYSDIQTALFAFVLQFCLEAWLEDLCSSQSDYRGFVENFYPVLADRNIFDRHLTPNQSESVAEFMREAIIAEIDEQRGLAYEGMGVRPYRWTTALTTYGVLLPDLERLWTVWWAGDTIGRAIAIVQYASCLIYGEGENPIFAAWTASAGGGPPCLWTFGGHLYEHRWLESNVGFIHRELNPRYVEQALDRAVNRLVGQAEHKMATLIQTDLPLCAEILAARCAELPRLLATKQKADELLEWSE